MPRRPRYSAGGLVYHVLNRASARTIFNTENDYSAFERLLQKALQRTPTRLLAYCIMPNHWHSLIWPNANELSEFMRWLTVTHTQRWHLAHGTSSSGPLYQGRFKSFPVDEDDHYFQVCRYVRRNPLRANLVTRAELWRWSSLWQATEQRCDVELHACLLPRPSNWLDYVNQAETEAELKRLRDAVQFNRPFGSPQWQRKMARRGRESSNR